MRLFTIYKDPSDFPGKIVVRGFTIVPGESRPDKEPLYVGDSLREAREEIQFQLPGAGPLSRHDDDDDVIEEVWL